MGAGQVDVVRLRRAVKGPGLVDGDRRDGELRIAEEVGELGQLLVAVRPPSRTPA